MRIAVSVRSDAVSTLSACEGFRIFEDDHGHVIRSFFVAAERAGDAAGAVAQLEEYGVDALLTSPLSGEERLLTARAGIMLFPTFDGAAEQAAQTFLGGAVARDPSNTCNACGFQASCSFKDKGGCRT